MAVASQSRIRSDGTAGRSRLEAVGAGLALALPAAILLVLSFVSGGFFPDAAALAAMVVLAALVVRVTTAPVPFAGVSPALRAAVVVALGFALWTLVSGAWSDAWGRAVLEYDRVLLYLATLVLVGLLGRTGARARGLLHALAAASVAVSVAALAAWLLPEALPVGEDLSRERQGWPTSYWNTTGLTAALATVWTAGLACSASEPRWVRAAAAAGAPLAVAALIFTVSRGAVAVGALGLLVVLYATRSHATPAGLLCLVPAVGGAALIALGVDGLSTHTPSPGAVADGERAALALAAVAIGAAVLRAALAALDRRIAAVALPRGRTWAWAVRGGTLAVVALAFVALGGVQRARDAADGFFASDTQSVAGDLPARERLLQLGNNGRLEQWRVAYEDGFRPAPLLGSGAGTYGLLWTASGASPRRVQDAHSLYAEQLGELGLVGGAALVLVIALMLAGLALRARGPDRAAWGGLFAGALVWAVHAGIDWDWEMPAVSTWVFAAGGLALAAPVAPAGVAGVAAVAAGAAGPGRRIRVLAGLGCLLLMVLPALVWRSQTRVADGVRALQAGDCRTATHAALDAQAALAVRHESFEIIGYCEAARGRTASALEAVGAAIARDPDNWELHYIQALVLGAARQDPRAAARRAAELAPLNPDVRAAVDAFDTDDPQRWAERALRAPLPIPAPTAR